MQVPPVTQDDLQAFKTRHFCNSKSKKTRSDLYALQGEVPDEDDDGLGYYSDGVKRTLTNEQIAMFRHSEVYSLLRERQLLKENSESIDNACAEKNPNSEIDVTQTATKAVHEANHVRVDDDSNEEEEYSKFLEAERNNNDQSNEEEEYMKYLVVEGENKIAANASRKRKIAKVDGKVVSDRPSTHRRLARELDEVTTHDHVLDYGEEPSASKDSPTSTTYDNDHEQNDIDPSNSLSTTRSDINSINGSTLLSNKNKTTTKSQHVEYRYKAVSNALKDWMERICPGGISGPSNAEGPDMKPFLSQSCIEKIARSASNRDFNKGFDVTAIDWDEELVNKYAKELFSVIKKALVDAKEQPVQGRKIWWPTIGK